MSVEKPWNRPIWAQIQCQPVSNTPFSVCSIRTPPQFSGWHCHLPHWSFDIASICLQASLESSSSTEAPAPFTLLHIQRKLQRRTHDGICSKCNINILSLRGEFFLSQFSVDEIIVVRHTWGISSQLTRGNNWITQFRKCDGLYIGKAN